MDLVSVSNGISNTYQTLFDKFNQKAENTNDKQPEQSKNGSGNIVLVKQGSSGYLADIDSDEDGKITLEEFNKYCEENGVSEKDKIKMMTTMEFSKIKDTLVTETAESSKETNSTETTSDNDETSVYAEKGDEKYNEAMDTNKNGKVTYAEYVNYCTKLAESNSKNSETKESKQYSKSEKDLISTVEYEV